MATPKEHIQQIRKLKFSIGGAQNPLSEDLHESVKNLSSELYEKDAQFLIIQNAEDNEYMEGVEPSLEFVITSRNITLTGAPSTLLIFNNEKGFSATNIESICSLEPPSPPEKPLAGDCCGNGCIPCVWDTYNEELEDYNNLLKAYNSQFKP